MVGALAPHVAAAQGENLIHVCVWGGGGVFGAV